jgi:hypothetical protein
MSPAFGLHRETIMDDHLKDDDLKKDVQPYPVERRRAGAGGKGIRLVREEEREDQMAADLVLVEPEAGRDRDRDRDIDRVEWAKQLVANAVRSPHTRQAYHYALEQFFHWAAGRAVSRESVQGYVTWLGEMKFSPSTINQRLARRSANWRAKPSAVATWTARRRRRLSRSPG